MNKKKRFIPAKKIVLRKGKFMCVCVQIAKIKGKLEA